jgi:hypothetical protein
MRASTEDLNSLLGNRDPILRQGVTTPYLQNFTTLRIANIVDYVLKKNQNIANAGYNGGFKFTSGKSGTNPAIANYNATSI